MTDVASMPSNPAVGDKIKAIEGRFGKEFLAVLVDTVEHVWGATPVGIAAEVVGSVVEAAVDGGSSGDSSGDTSGSPPTASVSTPTEPAAGG